MPSQTSQKAIIANFVSVTGASERTASRFLKSTSYRLNEALEAFYSSNSAAASSTSAKDTQLNKFFDGLRGEQEKDVLGAESCMNYLQSVGVELEDASLFIAMELLKAPGIGEITREGFVNGWKETGVEVSIAAQAVHLKRLASSMARDRDHFRKVYRYAFVAGKEKDQRALALDMAVVYWDTLFKHPGPRWVGSKSSVDWLEEWKTFLQENWKRSVNRDMWNQTLEFAFKSTDDEALSFWSEDASWPGVIDDFVVWYRQKDSMEIDK
ncbi:DUF298-domain-containing protein [Xylariaceae sp. FL0594]|nr:DUF298-domain-containing protein [Xylariaceae sp. FL0594]